MEVYSTHMKDLKGRGQPLPEIQAYVSLRLTSRPTRNAPTTPKSKIIIRYPSSTLTVATLTTAVREFFIIPHKMMRVSLNIPLKSLLFYVCTTYTLAIRLLVFLATLSVKWIEFTTVTATAAIMFGLCVIGMGWSVARIWDAARGARTTDADGDLSHLSPGTMLFTT